MSTNNMSNFIYGQDSKYTDEKNGKRHWIIDFIRDSEYFKNRSASIYEMMIKDSLICLGDISFFRQMLNKNDTSNTGCILTRNLVQEISAIKGVIGKEERSTELLIDQGAYEDSSNLEQIKQIQSRLNKAISTQLDFKIFDLGIDRLEQRLIFGCSYVYYYIGENEKIKYRFLDPLQVYESEDNESYFHLYEDFESISSIQMRYGLDQKRINEIREQYNSYTYEYSTFYNNNYKEFLLEEYQRDNAGLKETAESIMLYSPKNGTYARKRVILDSTDKLHVVHAFISVLTTSEEIVNDKMIKTANTICRHFVFMADQLVFTEDLNMDRPPIVRFGKKMIKKSNIYGYRGIAYACLPHVIAYSAVLSRTVDGCVNSPAKKVFIKAGILKDKQSNISSSLKNTVVQISNNDIPINQDIMATDMGLVDQGSIGMLTYLQQAIRMNAGLLDMSQLTNSAQQEQLRLNIQENSLYQYANDLTSFMKCSTHVIANLFSQLYDDVPDDLHRNMSVRVMLARYSESYNMGQLNKIISLAKLTGNGISLPMRSIFKLLDIDEEIQESILGTMEGQSENVKLEQRGAEAEVENKEADTVLKKAGAMQKTADAIVTLRGDIK